MMHRKILIVAIVALQIVLFGGLIGHRVANWGETGWTGLAFHLDTEVGRAEDVEPETPHAPFFWRSRSRGVQMVVPGGPADRAGIEEADAVVSVDGIPVAEIDSLQAHANGLATGDTVTYVVERGGVNRTAVVKLEDPYRHTMIVVATVTSVAAGVVFLLISMLVYWSRPRSQVAVVFFLMCVFGAAEYLTYAAIELDVPSLRGIAPATMDLLMLVGLSLVGIFSVALINSLLHLSLIFPRRRPVVERWPEVLVWLHTLPFLPVAVFAVVIGSAVAAKSPAGVAIVSVAVAVGVALALVRLRRRAEEKGLKFAVLAHPLVTGCLVLGGAGASGVALRLLSQEARGIVAAILVMVSFAVALVAIMVYSVMIVIALYRSYREAGIDEKQQLRWPLWGTLTAVTCSIVLTVVSLVLSLFFGEVGQLDYTSSVVLAGLGKIVYLLIPVSFAFGIVKYRLMEIDVIIRKTVVYTIVTGIVLVIYLVLAGASGLAILRSAGLEGQVATVAATLVVVVLFVPVRNRVQRLVDGAFFRRERDTEAAVARISGVVTGAESVEAMALDVAEEVQKTLRVRTVAVLERRSGSGEFRVAATVGLPDRVASDVSLSVDSGAIRPETPRIDIDGGDGSNGEERTMRQLGAVRAMVGRRGQEPMAVMTVGRKLSPEPFDEEDEVFMETVAAQLATGVGRLHGRRAEIEFAQALQIQRSLLPSEIPQIHGAEVAARWQPAREVSGDYYDVLELSEDRLALCIGDVVGKGMPAALLMSSLQASVKAVATAEADPAAVCSQVRSVVTSNLTGGKFVTFFYAVLDGTTHRLRYTNCGHNQPVLVRGDGSAERLAEGGPAFARLMRRDGYRSGVLELRPGDRLVLFTDGVSEAADTRGKQFGEERIVELVKAHRAEGAAALERTISESVLAHAEGTLQDDLTLVVVAVS